MNNLSLKFERGLDADVIKLIPLSDDYSKVCIGCYGNDIQLAHVAGSNIRRRTMD